MFLNKSKCTSETMGIISSLNSKGLDSPTIATVKYVVNDKEYILKENLKFKNITYTNADVIVGQKKIALIPNCNVGGVIKVCYDSNHPKKAYLKENDIHIKY